MMRTLLVRSCLLAGLLVLAPTAASQLLSQSSNYQLAGLSLAGVGGGQSSLNYSTWLALGEISDGELQSSNFKSGLGFLESHDPEPTNAPILFGVSPPFGPKEGGTQIRIGGLNFDKFATGSSVMIGGNPTVGNVVTNTQIIVTTPAGIHGPQSLTVSNPFGTASDADGFIYTPAITSTPVAPLTSSVAIRNYGPVGDTFWTLFSLSTTSVVTHAGLLLIGGITPIRTLFADVPYPASDGVAQFTTTVPNNAALHGLTFYFQSISISQSGPGQVELTNRAQTAIP